VLNRGGKQREQEVCGRAETHELLAVTKGEMLHVAVVIQACIHVAVVIHTCLLLPSAMMPQDRKVRLSKTIIGPEWRREPLRCS